MAVKKKKHICQLIENLQIKMFGVFETFFLIKPACIVLGYQWASTNIKSCTQDPVTSLATG